MLVLGKTVDELIKIVSWYESNHTRTEEELVREVIELEKKVSFYETRIRQMKQVMDG